MTSKIMTSRIKTSKIQWLATIVLTLAGVALLCAPAHAAAAAFTPTRFTVTDEGTAGKPDILLIPGLGSSRAVWDGEAAKLAPSAPWPRA